MNLVRTTITIPSDTHEFLMLQSFSKKKTLGELVDGLVKNNNYLKSDDEVEKNLIAFRNLCKKMAKKAGKTDWMKLIREERDRDE
ncbi:MAG: hypothetical protein AAB492_04045 [Patescibacteria group bacterium]